jgi:hypothetical protein
MPPEATGGTPTGPGPGGLTDGTGGATPPGTVGGPGAAGTVGKDGSGGFGIGVGEGVGVGVGGKTGTRSGAGTAGPVVPPKGGTGGTAGVTGTVAPPVLGGADGSTGSAGPPVGGVGDPGGCRARPAGRTSGGVGTGTVGKSGVGGRITAGTGVVLGGVLKGGCGVVGTSQLGPGTFDPDGVGIAGPTGILGSGFGGGAASVPPAGAKYCWPPGGEVGRGGSGFGGVLGATMSVLDGVPRPSVTDGRPLGGVVGADVGDPSRVEPDVEGSPLPTCAFGVSSLAGNMSRTAPMPAARLRTAVAPMVSWRLVNRASAPVVAFGAGVSSSDVGAGTGADVEAPSDLAPGPPPEPAGLAAAFGGASTRTAGAGTESAGRGRADLLGMSTAMGSVIRDPLGWSRSGFLIDDL